MFDLALSLTLSTAPAPSHETDWLAISLGVLGAAGAVGASWNYILEDKPNQKPKLAVVPPLSEDALSEQSDLSTEDSPLLTFENPLEIPVEVPPFPDIDFDADPTPPAACPLPETLPVKAIQSRCDIPGEVDAQAIARLPWEERLCWLVNYSEQHNLSYLLKLMQATPIVIYGLERSGKNTLACTIGVLRRLFFPQPMIACSPHANRDNPFPGCFLTAGHEAAGANYRAIAAQIDALRRWVMLGDTVPVTMLWDEASSYKVQFHKNDSFLLDKFLFFCMTETAKHEKFQIVLASGMTNDCLPGAEGTSRDRGKGIVAISRFAEANQFGKKSPSPHIEIEGMIHAPGQPEKQSFLFPQWLNAKWLLTIFPEANEAIVLPERLEKIRQECLEVTSREAEVTSTLPEVTSREAEVREVKPGKDSNVLTFPTSNFQNDFPDRRKLLFLALKAHLNSGKSVTWVVEEVLKLKGRKFAEGKRLVEELIREFDEKQTPSV